MKSFKDLISKNIIEPHLQKNLNTAYILKVSQEFIEKIIPQIDGEILAKPSYIKNDVLTIICSQPVVSQEIILHEKELLSYITKKTNIFTIKRIKCTISLINKDE